MEEITHLTEKLHFTSDNVTGSTDGVESGDSTSIFLNIPLEIREEIYRMVLTTPYCTIIDPEGPHLKFQLQPAILLVNKRICEEARRILHEENAFIVLKTCGIKSSFDDIPQFKLLPEDNIKNPVLRVQVAVPNGSRAPRTFITTPEGLDSTLRALWTLKHDNTFSRGAQIYHGDLGLTLDFNPNSVWRYKVLEDLVMKPWMGISGFKDLVLIGDIKESTRELLYENDDEGPFRGEIDARLERYHSLAEQNFLSGDFSACRWWLNTLEDYRTYLVNLRPSRLGGLILSEESRVLEKLLESSLPQQWEERLMLVKACIRQERYADAVLNARKATNSMVPDEWWTGIFNYKVPWILKNKFSLAESLLATPGIGGKPDQQTLDYILSPEEPIQKEGASIARKNESSWHSYDHS
jgi:hypothetical protein